MSAHLELPEVDRLTSLLSLLPVEVRLKIYELCLPCMWHRKRRIRLDYIGESRWMATSRAIFAEAAPLVFTKPLLFVFTSLDVQESLANGFCTLIERVFPDDLSWTLKPAQSMVEKLAITIRFLEFYKEPNDIHERLPNYFKGLSTFTELRELQISLGPEYIPFHRDILNEYAGLKNILHENDTGLVGEAASIEPFLSRLRQTATRLRAEIPEQCEVQWRFDRAGRPSVPSHLRGRAEVVDHLEAINMFMQRVWNSELDLL